MRFSAFFSSFFATLALIGGSPLAAPRGGALAPIALDPAPVPAPPLPAPGRESPRSDEPPVTAAILAGVATAMIPLSLGGVLASSGDEYSRKNAGLLLAGAGVALAPMVSHAVLREWKRGLLFSILPVASEIAMTSLLTAREDAVFKGTTLSRTTFALLFSVDVFGSAIGIVDAMMAGDRARGKGFLFAPTISQNRVGFTFGGSL
jgi:hypothetical protein